MATGDSFRHFGTEFVIVWSGAKTDFSLLSDYARPSSLLEAIEERFRPDSKAHHKGGSYAKAKAQLDELWKDE